jgi:hypothetical protein
MALVKEVAVEKVRASNAQVRILVLIIFHLRYPVSRDVILLRFFMGVLSERSRSQAYDCSNRSAMSL